MKEKKLYLFLLSFSLIGYAWLAWNVFGNTEIHNMPAMCLFKEITHLPCPSCGTTRSLVLLTEGRVTEAVSVNPLGIFLAIAMIVIPFWIIIDILRKRDSFFQSYLTAERLLTQKAWLLIPAIAVVMLNWFWNITKGL